MFELSPLWILVIGIVTVLGMIIILRLNAFLALITAAMVVSVLAPGETTEKISRVATAFGGSAGNIGIVIALAAIIGKCMMDSGAADRVVRAFLRLLGEKRASFALMGSGFVLAVPVFFDTVFYLLVPLARSLYRSTSRNYLKYILAIAAGGAITHTLVPPTPGPLLMASNLNIDVGLMILVGGMVAIPAALAGLIFARVADGVMPLPMRQIGAEPDPDPLEDSQLPSLFASLLPVVLPVLLISTNTVLETLADAERKAQLTAADVQDWPSLVETLNTASAADAPPSPGRRIMELLPSETRDTIETAADAGEVSDQQQAAIVQAVNQHVLTNKSFYQPAEEDFDSIVQNKARLQKQATDAEAQLEKLDKDQEELGLQGRPEWEERKEEQRQTIQRAKSLQVAGEMLSGNLDRMKKVQIERMNRLLLESALPQYIRPHNWNTELRYYQEWAAVFGNANLALLLSTVIAMWVYYIKRKPSGKEFAKNIEIALMSGGVIILITAAGGAFGEMLKAAQIGSAIQNAPMFQGASSGMLFLLLGFGIAAMFKVAQGSSTVAMITSSSMLAAMLADADPLQYNTVYLATAIGAGSLIGSWMNDSGFWIFAKMGGLTEAEALKSWTVLLIVLGLVSLGTTCLLAYVLPQPL